MADRFYVNCALTPGPVLVQGAEAHHLAVVCRLRAGDQVCLFNGDGHEYPARVEQAGKREVSLTIAEVLSPPREPTQRVAVAAPLPKGDRGQFLIEKLTELGVATFVPLRTQRSVVHPGAGKHDKLERHVIEASKQCGRNVLMRVEPLVDLAVWLKRGDLPATRILGHPGGARLPASNSEDVAVTVGPEGGFTDEEMAQAQAGGWRSVDLGPRILRIETAALALAAWATGMW